MIPAHKMVKIGALGQNSPPGMARQEALPCRAQRRGLTDDPRGALMGAKGASLPKQKT